MKRSVALSLPTRKRCVTTRESGHRPQGRKSKMNYEAAARARKVERIVVACDGWACDQGLDTNNKVVAQKLAQLLAVAGSEFWAQVVARVGGGVPSETTINAVVAHYMRVTGAESCPVLPIPTVDCSVRTILRWEIQVGNEAELVERAAYSGSRLGAIRKAKKLARERSETGMDVDLFRIDESCGRPAGKATLTVRAQG